MDEEALFNIRIALVGVGGAGGNCVTRVFNKGIKSAKLIAINTDKAHLYKMTKAHERILLGKGLGAGGDVKLAKALAEKQEKELRKALEGYDLVFITAGMGGGTGTGVAPLIAKLAKEQGAITVAMVGFPFKIERSRIKIAHQGIQELINYSDTVVVIDNNKLLEYVPNLPINDAFALADEIIGRAVKGIADAITFPSLINVDFADVRSIMSRGGLSMIAVGEGKGHNKVEEAVHSTLHHPLLDVDFEGAKGALVHLEGSMDLTLGDAIKTGEEITKAFDKNAEVKLGARINPAMEENSLYVTAIVTGVNSRSFITKKEEEEFEEEDVLDSLF